MKQNKEIAWNFFVKAKWVKIVNEFELLKSLIFKYFLIFWMKKKKSSKRNFPQKDNNNANWLKKIHRKMKSLCSCNCVDSFCFMCCGIIIMVPLFNKTYRWQAFCIKNAIKRWNYYIKWNGCVWSSCVCVWSIGMNACVI